MHDPLVGGMIGRYQVAHVLGKGAMGTVYRATHTSIGHEVAIKVLLPEISQHPKLLKRFFREAKTVASLRDPGVPQMHDVGTTADGRAYLVMELLDGESLGERLLRKQKLPVKETLTLSRHIARTLAVVHEQGIVHRDLKPDNIFIVKDASIDGGERAKVLDFGVAKLTSLRGQGGEMTMASELLGTPLYMAPEQCQGAKQVDARADVYALGCILFRTLCGVPPFMGETLAQIIAGHLAVEPPLPSRWEPSIPGAIDALILRCLTKDRHERLGSMRAFVEAVDAFFSQDNQQETAKEDIEDLAYTVPLSGAQVQQALRDVGAELPALERSPSKPAASDRQGATGALMSDAEMSDLTLPLDGSLRESLRKTGHQASSSMAQPDAFDDADSELTIPIDSALLNESLQKLKSAAASGTDKQSFADAIIDYTIPIDGAVIEASMAEAKRRRESGQGASDAMKESWAFTQPIKPGEKERAASAPAAMDSSPYSSGSPVSGYGQQPPVSSSSGGYQAHMPPSSGGGYRPPMPSSSSGEFRPPMPSIPGDGMQPISSVPGGMRSPMPSGSLDGMRPPMPSLPDDGQRPPMPEMDALRRMRDEPSLKPHHYIAIAAFIIVIVIGAIILIGF